MKNYYLIAFIFFKLSIFGQDLHDNTWILGYKPNDPSNHFGGTKIIFNNNKNIIEFFKLNINFESCGIFSDSNGKLDLFTNGCNIQNRDSEIIEFGDTLIVGSLFNNYCPLNFGLYPTRNSSLFLPGISKDEIILLQLGEDDEHFANIMQITYINKLGMQFKVVKKAKFKTIRWLAEGIQAIRHGNGRDWWIVLKQVPGNTFVKYLLTSSGVAGPYFQDLGPMWNEKYFTVQAAFSGNGNWYASLSEFNGLSLFKFNRCSGNFSLFYKLTHPPVDTTYWYPRGGVCFSPNNRYLYVSAMFGLYQYDLQSSNIENSGILIDTVDYYFRTISPFPSTFFQMQLAPDGRIYCNTHNGTNFFHVIHFPDKRGRDCMLKQHDLFLPSLYFQSMPNFAHYRTYDWDGSPCDTLGINKLPRANFRYVQDSLDFKLIEFVDLSAYQATSWSWDFGDPNSMQNTSKDQHPIHQFSDKGSYRVCLTATNRHGNHIFCDTLHIGTVSADDVPPIEIEHRVVMMPNPCSDILYFNFNNYLPQHLTVKISTLSGQLCMQTRISPLHNKLRIDQLLPGAYYVQLFENGKLIRREMVVKE